MAGSWGAGRGSGGKRTKTCDIESERKEAGPAAYRQLHISALAKRDGTEGGSLLVLRGYWSIPFPTYRMGPTVNLFFFFFLTFLRSYVPAPFQSRKNQLSRKQWLALPRNTYRALTLSTFYPKVPHLSRNLPPFSFLLFSSLLLPLSSTFMIASLHLAPVLRMEVPSRLPSLSTKATRTRRPLWTRAICGLSRGRGPSLHLAQWISFGEGRSSQWYMATKSASCNGNRFPFFQRMW